MCTLSVPGGRYDLWSDGDSHLTNMNVTLVPGDYEIGDNLPRMTALDRDCVGALALVRSEVDALRRDAFAVEVIAVTPVGGYHGRVTYPLTVRVADRHRQRSNSLSRAAGRSRASESHNRGHCDGTYRARASDQTVKPDRCRRALLASRNVAHPNILIAIRRLGGSGLSARSADSRAAFRGPS